MLNVQLARKYAQAIFEIAREEDKLVEYGRELAEVCTGIKSVPAASAFLSNPQVETKARKELTQKLLEAGPTAACPPAEAGSDTHAGKELLHTASR